tara:strand:+ start:9465 stop:10841 length:1377 start_codon:yes stop_codon:yes gene_type:complete
MIQLYNTLTRDKSSFQPVDPDHVKIYACGPTVYDYAHIGNARMAVVCDQLVRVLRSYFHHVTYVSNITDVDDKIIDSAKKKNLKIEQITARYTKIYNEDMKCLGVKAPDMQPKATEYIPNMIAMISRLIANNAAYVANSHVFFHVPAMPNYGSLSGRTGQDQLAGARVEVMDFKRDPNDFVLWKPSDADQPGWESPWGVGRPGWHIECSAMSESTLGLPFDIHAGGGDLIFPHHENEIAQSCCASGNFAPDSYAKLWFHNGFVMLSGEKMSKSLGNILLVHDLIEQHPGEAIRMALLSAHYRQPLNWTQKLLLDTKTSLDRMYRALEKTAHILIEKTEIDQKVLDALYDDINTPLALSHIKQLAKSLATANDEEAKIFKAKLIGSANLLGLLENDPAQWLGFSQEGDKTSIIEQMIKDRDQARVDKDFARADKLREQLYDMGVVIEDSPSGTKWRYDN